jgi:hypothetical protein
LGTSSADEPHPIRSQKTPNSEVSSVNKPACRGSPDSFSPGSPTKSARVTLGTSARAEKANRIATNRRSRLPHAEKRQRRLRVLTGGNRPDSNAEEICGWPAHMMVNSHKEETIHSLDDGEKRQRIQGKIGKFRRFPGNSQIGFFGRKTRENGCGMGHRGKTLGGISSASGGIPVLEYRLFSRRGTNTA